MRLPLAISFAYAVVSGSLTAQGTPPDNTTVTTELDQSQGNDDQVIYVINRSSHDIIVTGVRLSECENVQGSCATIRRKVRVNGGGRVQVHRVRARFPDQGTSFRYTFTWEEAPPDAPTAKDVAKDPSVLTIDTVEVAPRLVDLKVGETVDLGQVLAITAKNAKGQVFPQIWFNVAAVLGEDLIRLDGNKITGLAPGTAAIAVSVRPVASPGPPSKPPVRVVIEVVP